ncbi:hypothetical protein [Kurthia sibirica]|uniref:DUF3899 domain-containing protein n=1 Tax=Kurthia sibirica TaxID=202750 RepID=A0A2U3AJW4_9BACL|nr:hypothetical protein [Kurthia sibirica]PWI24815.1 hypothetical protein DEX24_11165 [Kurthia sibirica]GEK33339.1 hypothetical protein KSI01_08720 [Kurthia sibirica]
MSKKSFILILFTLIIEVLLTLLISQFIHVRFIEIVFFVALTLFVCALFFSSSGGALANYNQAQLAAHTGIQTAYLPSRLKKNPILIGTTIYFIIAIILFILLLNHVFN